MSDPIPKQIAELKTPRQITAARFSPDGTVLVTAGYEPLLRRWRLEGDKDFQPLPPLEDHRGWTTGLAFHPQQPWLVTADSWGQLRCQTFAEDQPAVRWRHDTAHDGWIRQLAISPDGRHLATCGRDRFLRLWNAESGALAAEHQAGEDLYAVAFHPTGTMVVSGDGRGRIEAWDFAAKKTVRTFDAPAFYKLDRIQDIAGLRVLTFLNDGQTLLAAGTTPNNGATMLSRPTMLAFDFAGGKLAHTFTHGKPEHGFIHDLAVHPDGYLIAVTSGSPGSGLLLLVRPGAEEPFHVHTKLANCHAIALHPDAKRFLVTATNRDSNGNGRRLGKDGDYPNNSSPLHWFELTS
ncbi:MAG: hypothetical protein QOE70_2894 [Chthoniobacter sp.]|jgi:WD40 repeat protein|nr:hypothetical protein [Chthoniobacter sp.]